MKKGFTLIEIIVTIALVALLATVIILGLKGVEEKNTKTNWERLVGRVESSASVYIEQNEELKHKVYEITGQTYVNITRLVEEGLLDENKLVDPNDNVKITNKGEDYKFVKVYLNDNNALEYEYPSTPREYIGSKTVTIYDLEKINLTTGLTRNNKKDEIVASLENVANLKVTYKGNDLTSQATNYIFGVDKTGTKKIDYEYTYQENGETKTIKGSRYYEVVSSPTPSCEIIAMGTKVGEWYTSNVDLTLKSSSNSEDDKIVLLKDLTTNETMTYAGNIVATQTENISRKVYYGHVKNILPDGSDGKTSSCKMEIKKDGATPTLSINNQNVTSGTNVSYTPTVTFGPSSGTVSCLCGTTNCLAPNTYRATSTTTVKCTATGNNGLKKEATATISIKSSCTCSRDSDCSTKYSCNGCTCYYDPPDDGGGSSGGTSLGGGGGASLVSCCDSCSGSCVQNGIKCTCTSSSSGGTSGGSSGGSSGTTTPTTRTYSCSCAGCGKGYAVSTTCRGTSSSCCESACDRKGCAGGSW